MLIATGPDRDERWEEAYEYYYAAAELEPSKTEYQKVKKHVGEIAVQKKMERELAEAEARDREEKVRRRNAGHRGDAMGAAVT